MAGHGEATYAKHWKDKKSDGQKKADGPNLLFLATDFRTFWRGHGRAYFANYQKAERAAAARREKKSAAGKKAAATRKRNKRLAGH